MKVYAFEWCDCVYESDFVVRSLHTKKDAAWRAMRYAVLDFAQRRRDDSIMSGYDFTHRHSSDWRIRELEVLE